MNIRCLAILSLAALFAFSGHVEARQPKKEPKSEKLTTAKKRSHKTKSSSSSSSSSSASNECSGGCVGPRGPQGRRGHKGEPGTCECVPSFLSVYTVHTQDAFTNGVIFDAVAANQGTAMSYDGISTVTFNQSGFYQVTYGLQVVLAFLETTEYQNAFFAINLGGSIVPGSVLPFSLTAVIESGNEVPYDDLLDSISIIVHATAGQTMQIVDVTGPECGMVVTGTETTCISDDNLPTVAYMIVNKLS